MKNSTKLFGAFKAFSAQLFLVLFALLTSLSGVWGQTTLISPTGDGGFENGSTFAANGWTAANSSTDSWIVGTTPAVSAGTNCAFISSTSSTTQTWTYSQLNVVQHLYKDVTIPLGESIVNLTFKWKVGGEGTTTSDWDNLKVFWGTTTSVGTPTANTAISSTYQISGTGATSGMYKLSSSSYSLSTIALTGIPGTTYRLVFSWKSDNSDIANPPAAIDEVSLTSAAPISPNAPITFTTSAVTSAGMTIKWVDNSTNETAFIVYRSTDNVTFTQVGSNISTTTAAGTGTLYSQVQTGLLPNTTYYYRISALFEAESSFLTGSQSTNLPGTFISATTGNFGTAATWDLNSVPTPYDNIEIASGHTVTIDASSQSANNVVVKGTLTYASSPISFAVNGNLTVDAGGVVNVFNATTGKTLTVAGNITNNGTMDFTVGGTASLTTGASLLTLNGTAVQTVSGTGTFLNNKIGSLTCSNTSTATPNIIWQFDNILIQHVLNLTGARFDIGTRTLSHGSSFNTATASISLITSAGCGFMPGAKYRRWFTTGATGGAISAGADPTAATSRFPFVNATGTNQRWVHIQRSSSSTSGNTAGYLAVKYNDATTATTGLSIEESSLAYTITNRYDANWTITAESGYVYASGTHSIAIVANNAFYASNGNSRLMLASATLAGTHQNGTITPGAQRIGLTTAQLTAGDIYMGINAADIPFVSVANGDWENPSTWNKNAVPSLTSDIVYIANGTTVAVNATAAVSSAITIFAGGTLNVAGSTLGITGSLINNGLLNISTGSLNVGSTLTNSGTINSNSGNLIVNGGTATGITNSSTGTFIVAGGTVRQGPIGGGNTLFLNSGILTVSSGNLNINGSLTHSGSQFNQSGGNINIDPNAAGVTANSSTSSNYTLNLTSSSSGALNWTGGILTIIDPPASTSLYHYSIYYYMNSNSEITAGHTLQFGDGVSSEMGGSVNGFTIYNYVGSYKGNFNNIIINGPATGSASSTNRIVKQLSYSNNIYGDLTINSNGEFDLNSYGFCVGKNLNVNVGGILTTNGSTLSFARPSGTSLIVNNNNSQSINGGGTIRNTTASPTANLSSVQFANSVPNGITLNTPISISGTLFMAAGIINTTATNILTLGTATTAGTLTYTAGQIVGPFARTFAASNTSTASYDATTLFPVGDGTNYLPIHIDPVNAGGPVVMRGQAFNSNSGSAGTGMASPLSNDRWEALATSGSSNLTNCFVGLNDAQITSTNLIAQASSASGTYNAISPTTMFVSGVSGAPNSLRTATAIPSASYLGYFTYALPAAFTWTGATSTNWSINTNWNPQTVPSSADNIVIPSSNITNFPGASSITIGSGKTATLLSGARLTVTGTLTNNGTLTLESGATFLQGTSLDGNGTYNVKQTVTGAGGAGVAPTGRFWYMTVPLNSLTRGDAFGAAGIDNRLWSWTELGQSQWSQPISDNNTVLSPTTGYVFRTSIPSTTLNFSGTSLYSSNVSISNLSNSGATFAGCHLLSNPYTAYLDWEQIVDQSNSGTSNISSTYCIPTYDGAGMVYDTYNANNDVAVNPSNVAMTRYIAPMQAFWVVVNSAPGSISMTKSMLSHQAGAVGLKDITSFPAFARLNLVNGDFYDQVVIYTDVNATSEVEDYDSKKFFLPNKAQVYCPVGNDKLVINALKNGKAQTSAPLTLELPSTQIYKFEMAESFVENGLVILEDKQEKILQDMGVNPVYEFFGNSGVIADRFVLHFQLPNGSNNGGQAGVEDLSSGQISVISNHEGAMTVLLSADLTTSGDIHIFDEAGRLVAQKEITSAKTSLQLNNGMGVYFVRVQTPMKTEMKKVMVY